MKELTPTILIDSREQVPLLIQEYPTERATLECGDYTIKGFGEPANRAFIVERKTLSDLIGTLTSGRARFMREVELLRRYRFACILIEAERCEVETKSYYGHASPISILATLRALQVRAGIHIIWCGNADGAARELEGLVRQFCRGIEKDYGRLVQASVTAEAEAVNA